MPLTIDFELLIEGLDCTDGVCLEGLATPASNILSSLTGIDVTLPNLTEIGLIEGLTELYEDWPLLEAVSTEVLSWLNPLQASFDGGISGLLSSAYDYVLMNYPDVILDLSQILSSLPSLDFINPLTVNLGNTLADRNFDQLVVFGDSLSDTGNLFQALGGAFPPSPPFFNGRFSNGPLWLEYLAPELGLQPSQITNFAFSGATSGRGNIASLSAGQDLGQLPGVLDQVDLFAGQLAATGQSANPNALYVVWGGANDFLTLPQDTTDAIQSVIDSVENVAQAVTTLAGVGARTIVVPNLADLGVTPLATARNLNTQARVFSTVFNVLLQGTLGDLEQDLGIDIVQVDVFSLSQALATRPSEFGFTNVTDPLFQQPTLPVDAFTFAFADDFHPTTTVHRLIGDTVKRSLSQPTPGQVLQTSGALVQQFVSSSGFRSTLEGLLFGSSSLTSAPLLTTAP
jgi:phospholipase/lecithinase/hemolysin